MRPRLRLTLVSRIETDTETLNRWYQCCKSALDMTQMEFSHWVKCMIFERNKEVMWLKIINKSLKTIWVCETNTYFLRLRPRLLVDGIKVWDWDWDSSIWSQKLRLILRLKTDTERTLVSVSVSRPKSRSALLVMGYRMNNNIGYKMNNIVYIVWGGGEGQINSKTYDYQTWVMSKCGLKICQIIALYNVDQM